MKFEKFDWLARGNRPALLLAMELLMQSGRGFVQNTEKAEIIGQLKNTAGKLIAETMLAEIADIAKELAELRTCKLLEYVKRSGLEFERLAHRSPASAPSAAERSNMKMVCSLRTAAIGRGSALTVRLPAKKNTKRCLPSILRS